MLHRHCLIVTVVAAFSCSVRADVVFVDATNCPGPGDGSELDPYCSIQAAIDNSVNTDEIIVAPGTYFETINFLGKAVALRSSDGPLATTIDAQQTGSVVTCESGEGPDTVLEGFTITGGNADGFPDDLGGGMLNFVSSPTVTNCSFIGNSASSWGGGMYNRDGSPTVTSCSFSGNSGDFGGGMFNDNSSPTVNNCTFIGNTATATSGGGMASLGGSSPTVSNCAFIGNTSSCNGAGMLIIGGSSTVINCTFSGHSTNFGAGMLIAGGNSTVINCTFSGNSADFGGGMAITGGSQTVINCIFSGNSAISSGGGMFNFGGSQRVTDCTFAFNSAGNGNALGFDSGPSDISIANCILWDGGDEIRNNDGSTITVAYSLVQGGFPGPGNIDTDPLFVDPLNENFRLSPGSPAIDAGNNWGVPPDFADLDADGDTTELTPWDLDGNPRFVHAAVAAHPGCGIPAVVDMGAYESTDGIAADIRLGDIDGNGTVNIADFVITLSSWGPCEPGCCLADLDLDGSVGIIDFLLLLGNWG